MDEKQEINLNTYVTEYLKRVWTRFDTFVFICAFSLAALVHMYIFTNKFINHDDVGGLYSDCGFGLSSGRWLLKNVKQLTGSFSSSWICGVVAALFLAAAVLLVVRLFQIKHRLPAALLTFTMVSFPVVASTYTYMFCAPAYLFALAMATIGVYLIRKEKIWSLLAGAVAISLGMGCYQAYFCFSAVLLVTLLGMDTLEGRFGTQWKPFLLVAIRYVAALALGMILYFVILKACLFITGTELVAYHGMASMGQLTLQELMRRIEAAYQGFFGFISNQTMLFYQGFQWVMIAAVAVTVITVVCCVWKQALYRSVVMLLFVVALLGIFPLVSGLMYLMTEAQYVHTVMMFPMVIVLFIPAVVMDRLTIVTVSAPKAAAWRNKGKIVVFVFLLAIQLLIGYEGFLITNRAYFCMDMTYENAYSYFVKLTTKIEMQEDYRPDAPLALIGYAGQDSFVPQTHLQGAKTGNDALTHYAVHQFLQYFLGEYYVMASEAEKIRLSETEQFSQMPLYPADGSIAMIDGVWVVKLTEP